MQQQSDKDYSDEEDLDDLSLLPIIMQFKTKNKFIQRARQSKELAGSNEVVQMITSENIYEQYTGLNILRKDLEEDAEEAYSKLEESFVNYILHILKWNRNQLIIYETLQILKYCSRASTQFLLEIIQYGSIEYILNKFKEQNLNQKIIELILEILGNIVSNEQVINNYMIKLLILEEITQFVERNSQKLNNNLINFIVWAIYNHYVELKTPLSKEFLAPLKIFSNWISFKLSQDTLYCICKTFEISAATRDPKVIALIVDSSILEQFVTLMKFQNKDIQDSSLNILIHLVECQRKITKELENYDIILNLGGLVQEFASDQSMIIKILKLIKALSDENLYVNQIQQLIDYLINWLNDILFSKNADIMEQIDSILKTIFEKVKLSKERIQIKKYWIEKSCNILESQTPKTQQQQVLFQSIIDFCFAYEFQSHNEYEALLQELKSLENQENCLQKNKIQIEDKESVQI